VAANGIKEGNMLNADKSETSKKKTQAITV